MLKLLHARPLPDFRLELTFSDHATRHFDAAPYLAARSGPLLEPLRQPAYYARCFIDAGALWWPNGVELSAVRLAALSHPWAAAA